MIKLTQVLFQMSDATKGKIERMTEAYEAAMTKWESEMDVWEVEVEKAKNMNLEIPEAPAQPKTPKPYEMKDTDYKKTEVPFYVCKTEIQYITQNVEMDTQLGIKGSLKEVCVKESPEEVYALLNN